MKQLIEEQKKQFEDKYKTSVLKAYPEYVESHMILLTDIWNWHISSLKQLIDGLITWQEEEVRHPLETISHLKKLKEELN